MNFNQPSGYARRPVPPRLRETPIVAVLRADTPEDCIPAARVLAAEGVGCIEMTLTTPGVLAALPAIIDTLAGGADVGVGTVLDAKQAVQALDAGAAFLVTPVADAEVVRVCVERDVPVFPGALTPTEVHRLWSAGASAVKVFPAVAVGSGYLGQLRGPFPDIEVVPSGGVDLSMAVDWIAAGALAVSVGGPLLGDVLRGGDPGALRERAQKFVAALRSAGRPG